MVLWHSGLTMLIVWFVMRGNTRIDYRVVAAASLIPDLIDKPLGRFFFREQFESGRLIGHTLLFNVAFFSILFFMRGRAKRKFTLIPLASLLHLAEDGMWNEPRIFWWPFFGSVFPKYPSSGGFFSMFDPFAHPGHYVQEAIGLAVICWLLASHEMLNTEGIKAFLRTGRLDAPQQAAA